MHLYMNDTKYIVIHSHIKVSPDSKDHGRGFGILSIKTLDSLSSFPKVNQI